MNFQSLRITDRTNERATVEMLFGDSADAELSGDFLKARLSIPFDPVPRLPTLELVALREMRNLIDERIADLESLLRRNHVDIP
jgi:hypothetical protein